MSLASSLGSHSAPSSPLAPPQVPPVPQQLPKIKASSAGDIAKCSQPSPEAQSVLKPQQTPSQYLSALQYKHLGNDMIKTMAHGMSDHDGVHWAAQSAEKVSSKLPPHEVYAMKAAQAWVQNPTPDNKAAAAQAASASPSKGPGALAAQGAAWSQPKGTAPRLTPHAVSGAVMSAAAIHAGPRPTPNAPTAPTAPNTPHIPTAPKLQKPQLAVPNAPSPPATVPPHVHAETFKSQHPFIAMGLHIASGKNPTPAPAAAASPAVNPAQATAKRG